MKVLLINPATSPGEEMGPIGRLFKPIPPLGIASIAGSLDAAGIPVALIDQFGAGLTNRQVAARAAEGGHDVVGISCLTATMGNVGLLVAEIRRAAPRAFVVLGNVHATVFHERLVADGLADGVIRGEGEAATVSLCRALEAGGRDRLDDAPGLTWRGPDGSARVNPPGAPLDLDALPRPAWHLLDLEMYRTMPLLGVNRTMLHLQASRGCQFRCTFCSQERMHDGLRRRSIGNVLDEIEEFHRRFGTEYFIFTDAYFPFDVAHGLAFADAMMARGLHRKVRWISETRVDLVSAEMLRRLRASGLELVMFGFESGSQEVLDRMRKRQTLAQGRDAARWAREAGIRTLGLFILGLPGETRETCAATVRYACEIGPDFAKFNVAIPFPGSAFYDDWVAAGGHADDHARFNSWHDPAKSGGALLYTPAGMTSAELGAIQRRAMLRFWGRPGHVLRIVRSGAVNPTDIAKGAYALVRGYLDAITRRPAGR